jgi:bifunctional non-homologous end joining protein LigD
MRITNPEKVLFPASGVRKKSLVTYYQLIAPYILPHIEHRPLSLVRFPEGADGETFYQKEANRTIDASLTRVQVEIDGSPRTYLTADNPAAVATFGTLVAEPHVWISRGPDFRMADIAVWDLDPPDALSFDHVRIGARLVKTFLENLGAKPFAKLTGSRGIHVAIRLDAPRPVQEVFAMTKMVADRLAQALPAVFTTEFARDRRGDRLYLDYLRNRYAQSFAAPFAVRALGEAPVAVPFRWEELDGIPHARHVGVPQIPTWLQANREWVMEWGSEVSFFAAMQAALEQPAQL